MFASRSKIRNSCFSYISLRSTDRSSFISRTLTSVTLSWADNMSKESVVIVGTGWAGYTVAENLDEQKYDITIISPQDSMSYTPLLVCFTHLEHSYVCLPFVGKCCSWTLRLQPGRRASETQAQTAAILSSHCRGHRLQSEDVQMSRSVWARGR